MPLFCFVPFFLVHNWLCKMKKRTRTPNSQPDQISRVCTYFNHYNLFGFIFSAISTYGKKKKKKQRKNMVLIMPFVSRRKKTTNLLQTRNSEHLTSTFNEDSVSMCEFQITNQYENCHIQIQSDMHNVLKQTRVASTSYTHSTHTQLPIASE